MMIGANLRFGSSGIGNSTSNSTRTFQCPASATSEATLLLSIAMLGIIANTLIMALIIGRASLRRWSQGLIFHQAAVDFTRATMLLPLAFSFLFCRPVYQCSIFETVFLLLASVSAVNLLTTVLNDTPLMPDDDGVDIDWLLRSPSNHEWITDDIKPLEEGANLGSKLLDAPHCVLFGIFMIWFAAITVNLGPTFITGALANHADTAPTAPSCPLIQTPYRHYIVNLLWVTINSLCLVLTAVHLYRLHRDLTRPRNQAVRAAGLVSTVLSRSMDRSESNLHDLIRQLELQGVRRIRMFIAICTAYAFFWGPLFVVVAFGGSGGGEGRGLATLGPPKDPTTHQVALYVTFAHAFVNPSLFLALHSGLRDAATELLCCALKTSPYRDFQNRVPQVSRTNCRDTNSLDNNHPYTIQARHMETVL